MKGKTWHYVRVRSTRLVVAAGDGNAYPRHVTTASHPLPPGETGFPLVGETIPFVKDMFGFMAERFDKHGPVFRSHILGNPTVFIMGAALTATWLDEECITREGAFPKNIQQLFGGQSLPLLDPQAHRTRKRLILSAFVRDAYAAYLPKLAAAIEASFARLVAHTVADGEVNWLDDMKRLAVDGILRAVLGIEPGPAMDAMLDDYRAITRGFTGLPINLPGTDFRGGLKARDRIFERLAATIDAHIEKPSHDGLSTILAAEIDGVKIGRDELILELHHIVIAGLIIFAEFACTVQAITEQPAIRAKLEAEVRSVLGDGPLTIETLDAMPYLARVVLETKRACANVPVSFGRAKKDFELGGFAIKEGMFVFMSVFANNQDGKMFEAPEKFDPERFAPGRDERQRHVHAYQPQGAGKPTGHLCAGVDFSTVFMKAFTALAVRDLTWTLPAQKLDLRWDIVPPEPKDGLRAQVRRVTK